MSRGIPSRPFVAEVAKANRMLTLTEFRAQLMNTGYPVSGGESDRFDHQLRMLRSEFRWHMYKRGSKEAIYCAPDVTDEEALAYCKEHHLAVANENVYDTAPLEAFTRANAWRYAATLISPAWRAAA